MNGISPPATIHRRLNNNELPIKKTGKIQEFWIFSAPPRAKALRIKPLRAPRTAFFAVIRRKTPQRPPPIFRLPPTISAEYARSRWNTRKKNGVPVMPGTHDIKYDYLLNIEVILNELKVIGNRSQPIAKVSKASEPSVLDSSLSSSVSASFSPLLSL